MCRNTQERASSEPSKTSGHHQPHAEYLGTSANKVGQLKTIILIILTIIKEGKSDKSRLKQRFTRV